jgi:hypothetical protein
MINLFTPEQLRGRFDCFSCFNRVDPICLKFCALNIRCALAKKQWFDLELPGPSSPAVIAVDPEFNLE